MARVVVASCMVRYPLGGMMSYVLQYLVGLAKLGHDVYFVEKADYEDACFDPSTNTMTDDGRFGVRKTHELLSRFGLGARWCFVDLSGGFHGMQRDAVATACRTADVFIDMGTHGAWLDEVDQAGVKVLLDGEPGYNQIRMVDSKTKWADRYDRHFTCGLNVGTERSAAPTAGYQWGHLPHPVVPELFPVQPLPPEAPFTTVMNWRSHRSIDLDGATYGQKDIEFDRFKQLPSLVQTPVEVAVAGKEVPLAELNACGWLVRDSHEVTASYDSFLSYLAGSAGEFGVCKNVFVALRTGWFSDRSAAYLASGRPVVLQDTGFSAHLPTGVGLFAVDTVEQAAEALEAITREPQRHREAARALAEDVFDARRLLPPFLNAL